MPKRVQTGVAAEDEVLDCCHACQEKEDQEKADQEKADKVSQPGRKTIEENIAQEGREACEEGGQEKAVEQVILEGKSLP